MNKINLLSEQLINQIAAGEVVDRPSSVVKELIENSIDAQSTRITIEIAGGGSKLIKITDNGFGMSREDAILCLERHATSKIASLEDLQAVRSMGFRGEAMASIASVSHLILKTRLRGDESGTELIADGGVISAVKVVGIPEGTELSIADLFFNTPARLKFLKSEQTEYQNIVDVVLNAALAFPNVAFRLVTSGDEGMKVAFDLPATDDEKVRIRGVLGKNISEDLLEIFYGGVNLKMTGYIGKPSLSRSNKSMQYFFVNDRPINSYVLGYAVKQAYHSLIPKERNPVFVIKFELEPSMVDVNCHPRKTEVKFKDEREVYRVLMSACSKALQTNVMMPKVEAGLNVNYNQEKRVDGLMAGGVATMQDSATIESSSAASTAPARQDWTVVDKAVPVGVASFSQENVAAPEQAKMEIFAPKYSAEEIAEENLQLEKSTETDKYPLQVLAQLDNSFILCQRGSDLAIVDQHAAHERIRYNALMSEVEHEDSVIQPLLMPVNVELSQTDIAVLNSNKDVFDGMGMEIEHFGGTTFAINSVPAFLVKNDLEKLLLGLLDDLRGGSHGGAGFKGDFYARKEKILTYMACRSAVKFGDALSAPEMVSLIEQLEATVTGRSTCPHGRPTTIVLESSELWSRFGRKYTGFAEKEKFRDVNC